MGLPSFDPSVLSTRHNVWRGDELGEAGSHVLATGHAALDAELPGGGWPVGSLIEVLQARPELQVWQLLLPVLVQAVKARAGPLVLIGAPHEPFGPALAARGLPAESLMWVRSEAAAARLWACEQALRCADVAGVLAWLPQARVGELRRLQLAAAQHEGLLFVFRPEVAAVSASPARLRLQVLASASDGAVMEVHLLKRRGPPLTTALTLPARSERIAALLAAGQMRRKRRLQQDAPSMPEASGFLPTVVRIDLRAKQEDLHAVDRAALAA
ncbi:MAG: translesion DNA synthesis-associated protein ImuA [Comamonadaceae bacterium]|nr:MAG: translesion DNA synthesis-associated protein ImuA [Comamonadaceae bacterium]